MPKVIVQASPESLRLLSEARARKAEREREASRRMDVFAALGFTPNPGPQTRFLELPDSNLDVLYGGAAGGSKSTSLLMYAMRACTRYPGLQAFWFRRTFPELEQSVLRMLARYGYGKPLGARYNESKHELRWRNESILTFAHAKNPQEASALLSAEINLLIIDERTTLPPAVVELLYSRVRSGVPGVPCLGVRSACVDEGDVLTETGWKPIQDVRAGDLVQSIDASGHMSLKPVEWAFAGPAADGLVRVDKRTLYMSMTPDHRVVHQRPKSARHKITPWNELGHKSVNIVRASASYDADGHADAPFGWDADDYLAFLGLFLAEGCTNTTVRNSSHKTVVTQCSEANQPAIKDLLCRFTMPRRGGIRVLPSGNYNVRYYDDENDPVGARGRRGRTRLHKTFGTLREAENFLASVRVPLRWNLSANGDFQISRKEIWEHFRRFGKAHEKFVPRPILEHATPAQLRILFDWMVLGDGSVNGTSVQYFTTSPQLADDVAEIALKLGYKVQMSSRDDGHPAHRPRHIVYCNGENRTTLIEHDRRPGEVVAVPHTGDVYCIKVRDNENFFLRQRGRIWVSGNTNPGQVGHAVAKKDYIDATAHGEHEVDPDKHGRRRIFIQARLSDTPQLGDEYRKVLAGLPERLRRAYEQGDWTVFEGQMFPELSWDRHVIAPFTIPSSWRRYVGVDWGFAKPWAVGWWAVDEDGRVYLYREIYEAGVGEAEQARRILAAEAADEHITVRYADDAMWAVLGDAKAIALVYADAGCHLTPAGKGPGSRPTGWQRLHSYLADGPACRLHRAMGWATCPMLHVFSTCPEWFSEVEALPYASTGNPEDADPKAADHHGDQTRYVLTNLGGGPQFPDLGDPPGSGVLDGVEVLDQMGAMMAVRPHAAEDVFAGRADEREHPVGTTQRSPFA